MKRIGLACTLLFFGIFIAFADDASKDDSAETSPASTELGLPDIDGDGKMAVPEGYREWVFVGSSLGLGYVETEKPKKQDTTFRHVYINPIGYQTFRDTGKFPVGTVLMLEGVTRGEKVNPALTGDFGDRFVGLEAAVKTGDRFEDPWSYYSFSRTDGKPGSRAARLTTKSCINCHREHAANDHVFTQFYPVLKVLHGGAEEKH